MMTTLTTLTRVLSERLDVRSRGREGGTGVHN